MLWMRGAKIRACAGSTYAPEGLVLDAAGQAIQHPADQPCLAQLAACAALCNDSSLFFSAGARTPWSAPFIPTGAS